MKKLINLFLTAVLCFCLTACASGKGSAGNFDGIVQSDITVSGLNNLRQVVPTSWDYALVAGDCIFTDEGYYRFEDVLEYNLGVKYGVVLGEEEERAVFFARGESGVYGVYRTEYKNGNGRFYAFSADYDDPTVSFTQLGLYPCEEAFVGQGREGDIGFILLDDQLVAFNFDTMQRMATAEIGDADAWDFEYFQRGNTSVVFKDGLTLLYTYDESLNAFGKTVEEGDYSLSENPAVIDGFYVFGGESTVLVKVGVISEEPDAYEAALEKYNALQEQNRNGRVEDGTYEAVLENGAVTVREVATGEEKTVTLQDALSVSEVAGCVTARDGLTPEITSVKLSGGEIFIVLEREPDVFAGLRDVNDGIPQIVLRLSFNDGSLAFCGLVDFTGYNVFRIVKL